MAASPTKTIAAKKPRFDVRSFLASAGVRKTIVEYRPSQVIFSQGDSSSDVMYLQEGSAKLSVLSEGGKEAIVAILGSGDFFGEACLTGQSLRLETATAIAPCKVLIIKKDEMSRMLHEERELADHFISFMLLRNIRIEADLVDQLFNSTEKRLARTLLLLARYGQPDQPQKMLPKISQGTLAEMVGTTRTRINFFMNKFKKLGFIEYNGGLHINSSLLSVVLHE